MTADPLAELSPRHAMNLEQESLFSMTLEEFVVRTKVSADEMERWAESGYLRFNPRVIKEFDERHQFEVEFLSGLLRCGLSDAWIKKVLQNLSMPYCYDSRKTFYSFAYGRWITLPSISKYQVIEDYLGELAEKEDWKELWNLRDFIDQLLPDEEKETDASRES